MRRSGDSKPVGWVAVDLPDAAGFLGGQDAAPALVRGIIAEDGAVSAFGDGPPAGGSGFGVARLWQSKDGVNWATAALPAAEAGSAMAGLTRSDGISKVIVGSRPDPTGPASWATRAAAEWVGGTFTGADRTPTASLVDVVEVRGVVIAVGLAPTQTDSLNVVVWGSNDGVTWSPLDTDKLTGGFVNDVVATADGRALAVGWQSGSAGGERGPTIWELLPAAAP